MPPTPESPYDDRSLEFPFYNPEDLMDLQRIGTPMSDSQEPTINIDTIGTGANKRIRRREQNRASYDNAAKLALGCVLTLSPDKELTGIDSEGRSPSYRPKS